MLAASLIVWIVTALFGFGMLVIWLRNRGREQRETGQIRSRLIFTHFGLAASGLVLWIVYAATDAAPAGWLALVLLVAAAAMGFVMFAFWAQQRRASTQTPPPETAERRFPVPVVAIHGVLAAITIVLVLLVNLGVGESDEESAGLFHAVTHLLR